MKIKKKQYIKVLILVFAIFTTILLWVYSNYLQKTNHISSRIVTQDNLWQPNISVDAWYWSDKSNFQIDKYQSAVTVADKYIIQTFGSDYFKNYIVFDKNQSVSSQDGNYHYLYYYLHMPDKGLDTKLTTHPTVFQINISKKNGDYVIEKNYLAELSEKKLKLLKTRSFIDRTTALNKARDYIYQKKVLPDQVGIDFEIDHWSVFFNVPRKDCHFTSKARITLNIDSDSSRIEEDTECLTPGV